MKSGVNNTATLGNRRRITPIIRNGAQKGNRKFTHKKRSQGYEPWLLHFIALVTPYSRSTRFFQTDHSPRETQKTHFSPALRRALKTLSLTDCSFTRDVFAQKSSENFGFILRTSAASARASFSRPISLYVAASIR